MERTDSNAAASPLLSVRELSKVYKGRKTFTALDGVSFDLMESETLGIVGESGSGKTTVAKIVAGIYPASSGTMEYKGNPLGFKRERALRREIQYIYQEPVAALDPKMTVYRILEEPIKLYYNYPAERREALIEELLTDVGLKTDMMKKRPREMSGGECQRIGIARALAGSPRIIVCDEPTSALDATIQAQILELMRRLREKKGFSYIFITHSLGVVKAVSERILVMRRGRIVEQGSTEKIFAEPESDYTKELLMSVPRADIPYYDVDAAD